MTNKKLNNKWKKKKLALIRIKKKLLFNNLFNSFIKNGKKNLN